LEVLSRRRAYGHFPMLQSWGALRKPTERVPQLVPWDWDTISYLGSKAALQDCAFAFGTTNGSGRPSCEREPAWINLKQRNEDDPCCSWQGGRFGPSRLWWVGEGCVCAPTAASVAVGLFCQKNSDQRIRQQVSDLGERAQPEKLWTFKTAAPRERTGAGGRID